MSQLPGPTAAPNFGTGMAPLPPSAADRSPSLAVALRPVVALIVVLAVVGAILGVVWAWWSPPVPAGVNLPAGLERQESKDFISADARFAVLVSVVGAVAAIGAWLVRRSRGPLMALGLAVGGMLGAWLTAAVGNKAGGGTDDAPVNTVIRHLELHVQSTASYFFEAAIALLGYSLLVAFAPDDDLGYPDPMRAAAHARRTAPPMPLTLQPPAMQPHMQPPMPPVPSSAPPQGGVEHAGGDGDGPGPAQQHHFPPQQPY